MFPSENLKFHMLVYIYVIGRGLYINLKCLGGQTHLSEKIEMFNIHILILKLYVDSFWRQTFASHEI